MRLPYSTFDTIYSSSFKTECGLKGTFIRLSEIWEKFEETNQIDSSLFKSTLNDLSEDIDSLSSANLNWLKFKSDFTHEIEKYQVELNELRKKLVIIKMKLIFKRTSLKTN